MAALCKIIIKVGHPNRTVELCVLLDSNRRFPVRSAIEIVVDNSVSTEGIVSVRVPAVGSTTRDIALRALFTRDVQAPTTAKIVANAAAPGCEGCEIATEPRRVGAARVARACDRTRAIKSTVGPTRFRNIRFVANADAGVKAQIPTAIRDRNRNRSRHRNTRRAAHILDAASPNAIAKVSCRGRCQGGGRHHKSQRQTRKANFHIDDPSIPARQQLPNGHMTSLNSQTLR